MEKSLTLSYIWRNSKLLVGYSLSFMYSDSTYPVPFPIIIPIQLFSLPNPSLIYKRNLKIFIKFIMKIVLVLFLVGFCVLEE